MKRILTMMILDDDIMTEEEFRTIGNPLSFISLESPLLYNRTKLASTLNMKNNRMVNEFYISI
jgi:hypothetical protein